MLIPIFVYAQKGSSFEGKHFIIGFMQNEIENDQVANYLQIFITTSENAQISISIPGNSTEYYNINKDSVLKINVPIELENRTSEIAKNITIEIESDVPIVVYTFNTQRWTSESYTAIPVAYWGKEYVVMSYPNDQYNIVQQLDPKDSVYMLTPRSSEFMILSAYDSTIITFQPKSVTELGKQTNKAYSITLNKKQCYLVKSFQYYRGLGDLTGTIVKGNKPFGLLSGHVRTAITHQVDYPYDSKNHLIEMLTPTSAWGRHFVSVPFGVNQTGDLFRITSIEPNTIFEIKTQKFQYTLNLDKPGDFFEIPYLNEVCYWNSNKPIQIGQFMRHTGLLDDYKEYDPCFAMVQPIEQYVSRILFHTPGNNPQNPLQFLKHFVTIVADDKAIQTLRIDTVLIKNFSLIENNKIEGTNLYWIRIEIYPGKHELTCDSGYFSGMVYGIGNADAYAMVLGASLSNPYEKDTTKPIFSFRDECGKLIGFISDGYDSISSGIDYVKVLNDSSYNYYFKMDKLTDTTKFVRFEANPLDYTKDAKLVVDYRDRNGNGGRFRYFYKGNDIIIPQKITFPNLNPEDSSCYKFTIKNNNDTTIELEYLRTFSNRIIIKTNKSLPIRLSKGDSIQVIICFKPNKDTSPLEDSIIVSFECGRLKSILLNGIVNTFSLKAKGFDFGYVYVGDTSCDNIKIINDGNLPIIIDSISFSPPFSDYEFYYKDLFPYTLQPGDSITIPVCFIPKKIGLAIVEIWFHNNYNISSKAKVTGTGIMPDVKSIVIDWGKRRIGTINDTTFTLRNNGNGGCIVKFDQFLSFSNGFDTKNIENLNLYLNPFSSVDIATSFQPDTIGKYFVQASCKVDRIDSSFNISLIGEGTLPKIEAHHIIFDTTVIYTYRDSLCLIIKSKGNEPLTINLEGMSGDLSSFIINNGDLSILDNIILEPDSSLIIPIRFIPQKLGWNEQVLYIKHDALPGLNNYDTAEIHLIGFAVTILLQGNLKTTTVIACKETFFEYSILNRSNININLQKLNLETENIEAKWKNIPSLPLIIKTDSAVNFPISIFAKRGQAGSIKISAQLQDTVLLEENFLVNPTVAPIKIYDMQNIKVAPGDTFELHISGKFPNEITSKTNFDLILKMKKTSFLCLNKQAFFSLINFGYIKQIPFNITQELDSLTINIPEILEITDPEASWQINLKFVALLNNNFDYKIQLLSASDLCYDPNENTLEAVITPVCANSIRNVRLISEPPIIKISPNPASDFLRIELNLPDDNELEMDIFNENGKKLTFFSKIILKKGLYCLIFEITDLTNGIYFLKIRLKQEIKNYIIIVSK